jgi:uncharacterized membrane protein YkoI
MKSMNKLYVAAGGLALIAGVIIAAKTTSVVATDGDDAEAAITGDALQKASAAALAHTGGGRVTDTEVGDEESLYEVEVTLDNGKQVDVQLDENFNVVGDEAEDQSDDAGESED